jgi:aconitate hydratase
MARAGGDPKRINPLVPVDLVIDHSVQVDYFGTGQSFLLNVAKEFERNQERYALLRWAQNTLENFSVVPPGVGICHQVNLEFLGDVVSTRDTSDGLVVFPDTLVGLDSHTTMINGLAVLGWGVGGIEAEAVMLGQPYYMMLPEVIGFKLTGELREGVTATDLVLTVTEMLRGRGVVEKFVEFFGAGLSNLPLADRATIANMAPEYGATCGFFPVDDETLKYLRGTGRDEASVNLVERYAKQQGLFRTDETPDPQYTDTLTLDMGTVESSLAGPRRPQDRVALPDMKSTFLSTLGDTFGKATPPGEGDGVTIDIDGEEETLDHGSVVIAAITSCTNTSNPSVMIGAGLLAKKAVDKGLTSRSWVKTSMAPGSQVVGAYLNDSGLMPYLEDLGFHIVGYGCTTCIGNSGPLPEAVDNAITEHDLVSVSVLSGNRNFEARVHPQVKANYLASPMLVVAYALVGRADIDLVQEPIGQDQSGSPVFLRDIWPTQAEVRDAMNSSLKPELFTERYSEAFKGNEDWRNMPIPDGDLFEWDRESTYVQEVPFFQDIKLDPDPVDDITDARVLVFLGDSVTTDHISPAGAIPPRAPAGQFLIGKDIPQTEFNTFGSRRGNHNVLVRGTFANVRLKNKLTPDQDGDWTLYMPDNEEMRIYDASMKYQEAGVPLVVIGGKEYGTGSSRDWAAKGPNLLGVKAVLVESFERIHRSNLIGMGVLPLQFQDDDNAESLGLTGHEELTILGIAEDLTPRKKLEIVAKGPDGEEVNFKVLCRVDTLVEVDYYKQGGVLQTVLRRFLNEK